MLGGGSSLKASKLFCFNKLCMRFFLGAAALAVLRGLDNSAASVFGISGMLVNELSHKSPHVYELHLMDVNELSHKSSHVYGLHLMDKHPNDLKPLPPCH